MKYNFCQHPLIISSNSEHRKLFTCRMPLAMKTSSRSIEIILFSRNEMFVEICHLLKSIPIQLHILLKQNIQILERKKRQKWQMASPNHQEGNEAITEMKEATPTGTRKK